MHPLRSQVEWGTYLQHQFVSHHRFQTAENVASYPFSRCRKSLGGVKTSVSTTSSLLRTRMATRPGSVKQQAKAQETQEAVDETDLDDSLVVEGILNMLDSPAAPSAYQPVFYCSEYISVQLLARTKIP